MLLLILEQPSSKETGEKTLTKPHLKKVGSFGLYRRKWGSFVRAKVCAHRTCVKTIKIYFHQNNTPISSLCMPQTSYLFKSKLQKQQKIRANATSTTLKFVNPQTAWIKFFSETRGGLSSISTFKQKICVGERVRIEQKMYVLLKTRSLGCSNYSGVNNRSDSRRK